MPATAPRRCCVRRVWPFAASLPTGQTAGDCASFAPACQGSLGGFAWTASVAFGDNASMAEDDFDVEGLAAHLHMNPAQIGKLADRGDLPGRRVGGQWRFSRAEVHHWLESRIGISDETELAQMENVLQRGAKPGEDETFSIAEMLPLEAIAVPLEARTRAKVITAMADLASQTDWLWDPRKLADAVRAREDMQPTALDNGVALLHPRRPLPAILGQAFLALGITPGGIPFGGSGGRLTDIFFLILSVSDRGHLRTLARLSRLIADSEFLATLRAAPDAHAVRELIAAKEATFE